MILTFTNPDWPKNQLGAVVDNQTKICTSAAPSIAYLKGQTLAQVVEWALNRCQSFHIKHTDVGPLCKGRCHSFDQCARAGECCLPDKSTACEGCETPITCVRTDTCIKNQSYAG